ncbi:TRAP transporter substrate-binding protein DctP [Halomonas elongata]|uniref:TRAP transporter substrate-binding protein n=2 Tax=Halomonas elongata TaxID=2746 RepID=E1V3T9_HALED|nr:TRAP transporter substrate-binding protein DctP [Halomonas elongata]MBW5801785.1 TRAP transporter substrate-binding protein DctP [Halomonas elongata]MDL4863253.1 TRAP transporter substrate-binding protein DctP [Halomonas elongata]RAW08235.1 ABC transporter substrate-binding protein [Halomonas elongata]WBF16498.1 TRAP transporter substrate-binding protein DctP [Halomonas elongata]WPU48939.1 TRAP transporter substrate-binding protein DctP [Halomonas elongata DSM 2581]
MQRKPLARLAALAALPLAMAGTQAQAQSHEMAIATLIPENLENNSIYPALVHFKELVESRTDGDLAVNIFGGGQMGSEVETGSQVQSGGRALQSSVLTSGAMSSFYGDYQVVTAPFLFDNWRQAWAFFDSQWFADFMSGAIEAADMRYLGTFDDGGGFVAFTNNEHLIKTVEDLEGLNIRTEENPAHVATMKALGASATPLPWGELITALETGLADGQFNAPVINTTYGLDEVTDYTTLTGHVYNSASWVVSETWFQELPEEYQRIVTDAAREAVELSHGASAMLATASWQKSCQLFEECYIMPTEERQRMAEIARPAWKKWIVEDFGADKQLVEDMLAKVDALRDSLPDEAFQRYGQ